MLLALFTQHGKLSLDSSTTINTLDAMAPAMYIFFVYDVTCYIAMTRKTIIGNAAWWGRRAAAIMLIIFQSAFTI